MAKSRNRNNQDGERPNEIEQTTDAEILEHDDQVEDQLIEEEELESMTNEESQQIETKPEVDETVDDAVEVQPTPTYTEEPKKKGSNAVWYGVAAVLVAAAVGGIYYSNQSSKVLTPGTVNQPSEGANPIQEVPADPQGLESNDPPLSESEVPEPNPSESFSTEMGEEESKSKFMGDANRSTQESSVETNNSNDSDVASTADVLEHQSGIESVTQDDKSAQSDESTVDSAQTEGTSSDEATGEQGLIISPEVGIGAFEQDELAKGEKSTEEMTSTDEPNAETVPSSEVEEIEENAPVNPSSEADEIVDTAAQAQAPETEVFDDPATDDTATNAPATQAPEAEVSVDSAGESEATQTPEATDNLPPISSNITADEVIEVIEVEPTSDAVDPELIAALEREYEVLTARQQQEIRRLQEELAGMQQHLQDTNSNAENLLLNDVSRLMQSAENELRFNGNVPNAVSILVVAQRIAAESKNKMLEGLVGAIGADIVALKSSEFATVDDMFKQVQQVATLVESAPLITPDYASHSHLMTPTASPKEANDSDNSASVDSSSTTENTATDAKWYERSWNQTKSFASKAYDAVASDLNNLVRVEKLSDPNSGLLSAEQAGIMRNNLKMQLSFAQQALMSRQQGIWQTSLMTVEQALAKYFRQDAAETTQAQTMLAELRKASVQPTMPDIRHSRRALSETYEQLRVQRSFQE